MELRNSLSRIFHLKMIQVVLISTLILGISSCGNSFNPKNPVAPSVEPLVSLVESPSKYDGEVEGFTSHISLEDFKTCCETNDRRSGERFAVLVVSAWVLGEQETDIPTQKFMDLAASSSMSENDWNFLATRVFAGTFGARLVPGVDGYLQSKVIGSNENVESLKVDIVFPAYTPNTISDTVFWTTWRVELEWDDRWRIVQAAYGLNDAEATESNPELSDEQRAELMPGDAWRKIPAVQK